MSGWAKFDATSALWISSIIEQFPPRAKANWTKALLVLFSTTNSTSMTTTCGSRTLAEMCDMSRGTVERMLLFLEDNGHLKTVKASKGKYSVRKWLTCGATSKATSRATLDSQVPPYEPPVDSQVPCSEPHQSTEYSDTESTHVLSERCAAGANARRQRFDPTAVPAPYSEVVE